MLSGEGWRRRVQALTTAWIVAWGTGCDGREPREIDADGTAARAKSVAVAAAADLRFALDEIVTVFEKHPPYVTVTVTYGSSGTLFSQIVNDAPFELYLSADLELPRNLIERGLAAPESLFTYAVGRLAVWAPMGSSIDPAVSGLETLVDPSVRRVAMANPAHAPYGRAAEATLKAAGIYGRVRDRLVLGENVSQSAQFVESGAADIGLIALSLAMSPALRDKGEHWPVPDALHPPIEQGGVIMKRAEASTAVRQLRDFILGPEGRAILGRHGFGLPVN